MKFSLHEHNYHALRRCALHEGWIGDAPSAGLPHHEVVGKEVIPARTVPFGGAGIT